MPVLEMWSDLHCPYAYLAAFRLRRALAATRAPVEVVHRALAIEWLDAKCTPMETLAAETPLLALEEPDLPYAPWRGRPGTWPVTMWPAFEAVKCAERQGWRAAHDLDWRLRTAFFAESRCISMRHEIEACAREAGLDVERLMADWDAGIAKREVLEESKRGWRTLDLEVSPTFVTPDGARHANPAAPHVELDARTLRPLRIARPAERDAAAFYARLLEATATRGRPSSPAEGGHGA